MPIKNNQQHINVVDLKFSGKEQQYKQNNVWPKRAVLQHNKAKITNNKDLINLTQKQQKQYAQIIMMEFSGKEQQYKQNNVWPKRAVRKVDKIKQTAKRAGSATKAVSVKTYMVQKTLHLQLNIMELFQKSSSLNYQL